MAHAERREDMDYVAQIHAGEHDSDDRERYHERGHRWHDDERAPDACRWCGLVRARAVGRGWRYRRGTGRWFVELPWCAP